MKLFISSLLILFSVLSYSLDIYDVLAVVESNNNPSVIGDNGKAIGIYQIHKIYVDDVNRILKTDKYNYNDRYDSIKSLEMVKIYTAYYALRYRNTTRLPITAEVIARIHNGGPNGMNKQSTIKYWNKVKEIVDADKEM